MLVECIVGFRDLDAGILRDAGDRFEVSPERFAAINGTRYGQLVKEVPSDATGANLTGDSHKDGQTTEEQPKKPARRGRTRKAAE
jgi:hypothetical protein